MKKLFLTTVIIVTGLTALFAQAPLQFNYQGVARGANGQALANQSLGLRISILDGSASGTVQYSETHNISTNAYGLYTLAVGEGTVVSGSMASVTWGSGTKFMMVEMDPGGGSNYITLGSTQLLSVPYALQAESVTNDNDQQTLFLSGSTLGISGGNSVTLPSAGMGGNGTLNRVSKFTGTTSLGNSQLFDNGTKIGFGTDAPSAKFDFAGGNGWDLINTDGDLKIGDTTYKLKMGIALGGGGAGWAAIVASNNLGLGTGITPTTQSTMNLSNGRVGIGIQNPTFKLHVNNTTDGSITGYFSDNSATVIDSGIVRAEYTGTGNLNHIAILGNVFYNGSNNAGIGVQGTAGFTGVRGIGSNTLNSGNLYGGSFLGYTDATAYGVYGYATYKFNANSGVKYGVYGSAVGGATNYGVYCLGNGAYTGTWTQVSDIKLKKNITPMAPALSKILQLKVYSYEFKTDDPQYASMHLDKGIHHGYLSQELAQVMPELVRNDVMVAAGDEKGEQTRIEYKGVNYTEMIPVLTKAMQEQQEIIQQQQNTMDTQEKTIHEQNTLIRHLQQAMEMLEQRIAVMENKQR